MGPFGKKWYSEPLEGNAVFMNDDFYKQRAREVRDIAAKADPFIKQRLLDLADRYDGKRKTSITSLPSAPAVAQNPPPARSPSVTAGWSGQGSCRRRSDT